LDEQWKNRKALFFVNAFRFIGFRLSQGEVLMPWLRV
jgi:hypothetical protein